jgi:hypothetical protein
MNGLLRDGDVSARLPAQDLERAKWFYAEKVGLCPDEERPGGLRYRCGSGYFTLFESAGSASGTHTQLAWEVDDITQVDRPQTPHDTELSKDAGRAVEMTDFTVVIRPDADARRCPDDRNRAFHFRRVDRFTASACTRTELRAIRAPSHRHG